MVVLVLGVAWDDQIVLRYAAQQIEKSALE
jgi:hypothetical protein